MLALKLIIFLLTLFSLCVKLLSIRNLKNEDVVIRYLKK